MRLTTILVVDDSEADQFLARHAIHEFDSSINVVRAYDGEEALAVLAAGEVVPDLIFLDINMPRMDGRQFLQAFARSPGPRPAVVVTTSSRAAQDREACTVHGFVVGYLDKPLTREHVAAIAQDRAATG